MILTGSEITENVQRGNISLEPFFDAFVNPNSYNYRLGDELLEVLDAAIDTREQYRTRSITIPPDGYTLMPGRMYLGSTYEKIGSRQFVPSLIGRSSLGRLGLFLQITADLGHLGTNHHWTLELTCVQPLRVYPFMKIGQVSFWKPEGLELLQERYQEIQNNYSGYSLPQPAIVSKFV